MADAINNMRKKARDANLSVTTRAAAKEFLVQVRKPTATWRMRPTFFLVGAMKAGTTSLFNNLVLHPQIAEPVSKEIRYFDFHYGRGNRWYLAHFPLTSTAVKRGETISGEASPSYMFDPHAPRRIKRFSGNSKVILLLRDPVNRAYSHFQHAVRYWGETRSFGEAIKSEDEWFAKEQRLREQDPRKMPVRRIQHSYLARGRYLEQLQRWEKAFGRSNMLILRAEDYFSTPEIVMPEVLEFLCLSGWQPDQYQRLNMAKYQKLDTETRDWAYDYFASHNQALYEYLGHSFEWEEQRDA